MIMEVFVIYKKTQASWRCLGLNNSHSLGGKSLIAEATSSQKFTNNRGGGYFNGMNGFEITKEIQ